MSTAEEIWNEDSYLEEELATLLEEETRKEEWAEMEETRKEEWVKEGEEEAKEEEEEEEEEQEEKEPEERGGNTDGAKDDADATMSELSENAADADATADSTPASPAQPEAPASDKVTAATAVAISYNKEGYYLLSSDTHGSNPTPVRFEAAKKNFYVKLLNICKSHPEWRVPIDQNVFVKVQAVPKHAAGLLELFQDFSWFGILPGGHRMRLPIAYIAEYFDRSLHRSCMASSPEPQDCTHVGSAVANPSPAETNRASASATVGVGPPKVQFPQGGKDTCVASGLASALHHAGCVDAALTVAGLAEPSLKETGTIKFVQTQCLERLKKYWQCRKLKNPADCNPLSFAPGELVGEGARVITVMQIADSHGDISHCVTMTDDGWLFDSNKAHALPLTQSGLDDCCLGDASFRGVVKGFHLVHTPKMTKVTGSSVPKPPKRRANSENACPNSPRKAQRASKCK